jgi:FkbM family methyltransferase
MFAELPDDLGSFYSSILIESIAALKMNTFSDNFDAARYNQDGKDHSKEFDPSQNAFYFDWLSVNREPLYAAYTALEDDFSKWLYLHLIAYRLAGHFSVRIPVEFAGQKNELEAYLRIEKSSSGKTSEDGVFGNLIHYDFTYEGNKYVIDCHGLEYYLFRKQYFYNRSGVSISPTRGDTVIDGGACLGDSTLVFSNAVGAGGKVLAFDPVHDHLQILTHNTTQFPHLNVVVMPYGLSDRNEDAEPIVLNRISPGFHLGNQKIPLRSIDSLVRDKAIREIDFIKLDVEGSEMDTLRGASESISRFKPKLAVSLYHKPNDLFEIILHIKQAFPFYKLYLGHYTIHHEETVLYCRSEDRNI